MRLKISILGQYIGAGLLGLCAIPMQCYCNAPTYSEGLSASDTKYHTSPRTQSDVTESKGGSTKERSISVREGQISETRFMGRPGLCLCYVGGDNGMLLAIGDNPCCIAFSLKCLTGEFQYRDAECDGVLDTLVRRSQSGDKDVYRNENNWWIPVVPLTSHLDLGVPHD